MHSFAFSCLQLVQEDPAQLGKLRGVLGRAAKLGRDLVDRLRRDGAVLVAQVGVLRLLEGGHHLDLVHGLASGDDDRVEFVEQLVVLVLLLVLLLALVVQLLGTVEIVDGEAVIVRRRRPEVRRAVAVLVAGDLVLAVLAAVVGPRRGAATAARLRGGKYEFMHINAS